MLQLAAADPAASVAQSCSHAPHPSRDPFVRRYQPSAEYIFATTLPRPRCHGAQMLPEAPVVRFSGLLTGSSRPYEVAPSILLNRGLHPQAPLLHGLQMRARLDALAGAAAPRSSRAGGSIWPQATRRDHRLTQSKRSPVRSSGHPQRTAGRPRAATAVAARTAAAAATAASAHRQRPAAACQTLIYGAR